MALGLPIVECSHNLLKINIEKQSHQIDLYEKNNEQIVVKENKENILCDTISATNVEGAADFPANQQNSKHQEVKKREFLMNTHTD